MNLVVFFVVADDGLLVNVGNLGDEGLKVNGKVGAEGRFDDVGIEGEEELSDFDVSGRLVGLDGCFEDNDEEIAGGHTIDDTIAIKTKHDK